MPQFPGQLGGDLLYRILVNEGGENDDAESILRKHLNPALKGDGWNAVIAGMSTGDDANWENAKRAFDQLFKISAGGLYLERLAADDGLQKPLNLGMPDELFRHYAIQMTNGKLVENALLEILEIFYGAESVRAFSDSGVAEPFVMADGETLTVLLDERDEVTVVFTGADFDDLNSVRAVEVAAAITRTFRTNGLTGYALANVDVTTGSTHVRIYSGALGLVSSVRVLGGSGQNILRFDTYLPLLTLPVMWDVTPNTTTRRTRFTVTGGTADLSQLVIGDYVNVFGTIFDAANRGAFQVVDVSYAYPGGILTQYFEVALDGVTQSGLTQVNGNDLVFFRPTRKTTFSASRTTVVAVTGDSVSIVLPATSQAVGRGPYTGAYAQVADALAVSTLERINGVVTVATLAAHGLAEGDQAYVDEAYAALGAPAVAAAVNARAHGGTSAYSKGSIWSALAPSAVTGAVHACAVLLPDGRALVAGGDLGVNNGPYLAVNTCQLFRLNSVTTHADSSVEADYDSLAATVLPATRTLAAMSLAPALSALDGQALLTGGTQGAAAFATTYAFDPTAGGGLGSWTAKTVMSHVRCAHSQTTLANGKVLAAGGASAGSGGAAVATAELYDPDANTWTDTAATIRQARCDHQAVLLPSGKVLVAGGRTLASGTLLYADYTDLGPLLATCEVYDPVGDTWTTTGPMSYARFQHQLVLLPSGKVLAVGGVGYDPTQSAPSPVPAVRDAEVYDPATGRWSPAGRLAYAHEHVAVALLPARGQLVVFGGPTSAVTELLDTTTMRWAVGPMAQGAPRDGGVAVAMSHSLVFAAGGTESGSGFTDAVIGLYVPTADQFMAGSLNGLVTVSAVLSPTSFQYLTPDVLTYTLSGSATAMVTPARAEADPLVPGPFTYDPHGGVAVTDVESEVQEALAAGHRYGQITVTDATVFPDEPGWLVFNFGFEDQVAPVKYFGRLSATTIGLDYGFRFPKDVPVGVKVTLLAHKGAFVPAAPETVGSFYLTASAAGRVAASSAIDAAVAAGLVVHKTVDYPGDRGLGGQGYPASGQAKLSDEVAVWGGDELDTELEAAREA